MSTHSSGAESSSKSNVVVLTQAVLAGLAFIFGGLGTGAISNGDHTLAMIGAVGTLVVGGANIAVGIIVQGKVVPVKDIAAYLDTARTPVAGPASELPNGTPVKTVAHEKADG